MAINEREFKRLKQQVDGAKTARDQATGQLEASMQRLKDEFDCDSLKDAERTVKKLKTEANQAETKYNSAMEEFEEAWGGRLQ